MKEKSHSIVNLVTVVILAELTLIDILLQSMKEKGISCVSSVKKDFLRGKI